MSWLNLNESFNSLKGQITNFASEVLSEVPDQDPDGNAAKAGPAATELEDKCRQQELEIASLKNLTEELQASLRLAKQNGVREEETSWYWDPPPQTTVEHSSEEQYKLQIRALQDEISTMRERDTIDLRPDTDEEVAKLREENQNLTKNLEDLDNQHQQAMERLLTLKKELQNNFEALKHDHEGLKNSNDEYGAEIKMLFEKLSERDKEVESMKTAKTDYETLHHKYQNLERIYGLLRENAEKFQEENQELHEEVFKLQEEVTKLEHDLEVVNKNTEHPESVPKAKYDELLREMNDMKERRNANLMHHDEINIDDNAKSVIEHLKRDITDLKYQLTQKEGEAQEIAEHKAIKSEKVMQLYNKYVNFEIPLDYVGEIPSVGDNIVLYKLESVFKTVNSFKREIDNLEHQLSEKNLNVNHLQTQIDDLTTENDFLTTDIQHFEQELNEMKRNNDFLISEIAALKNASKLEPIIEGHEDNLAKLESELDVCNNKNKTFESEINRIEKELTEVKTEKLFLQESLADLKSKYTTMLSEIEMCKNKTEAVEDLELTVHNQEIEKLKKVADEVDDLKKQLSSANSKNEQLTIDLHILENDKVLLTKQIDDLTNSLEEKSTMHKNLEAIKLGMDNKLQEFETHLDEVIKNKEAVEAEKQKLVDKVVELESQLQDAKKSNTENKRLTAEKSQLAQKLQYVIKENSAVVAQIQSLQSREEDLVKQINNIKAEGKGKGDADNSTKEVKDTCIVRVVEQKDLHKEITSLKQENHKLTQRNVQLETELASTDEKISHLDEEFNNLREEINEKDELIDSLNTTIHDQKVEIFNLNKTLRELNESIVVKDDELERLRLRAESLSHQLVGVRERFNQNQEELHIARSNSHEIGSELSNLREEMNLKNAELETLVDAQVILETRFKAVEKARDDYHATILEKDKEIEELNQSINKLTEKFNANVSYQTGDHSEIIKQKELLEKELAETKNNVSAKEKKIEELNQSVNELTEKLKASNQTADHSEIIQQKELLEKELTEAKNNVTAKEIEIEELNQSINELTEKLEANASNQTADHSDIIQEKKLLEKELTDAKNNVTAKEKEIKELKLKTEEIEKSANDYKTIIDKANAEKTELINLINLKHNESIQYHNEIQRLNHVLLEQNNEFKRVIEEKDKALQNTSETCNHCERLRITLKEKDDIITNLNNNATEYERLKVEMQNASEVVNNLTEKCDNLDKSLSTQLEMVKKLTAENAQLSEQEVNSTRELERLRRHLVETEESYTAELMTAEQKLTECQTRLHQVEERAKQTTTVYTSNSIRANQEVETLRNQMRLIEKQRDEVQTRLSEAEDARSRSEAALTNLQIVLDQFTQDKEREIHAATEKIRNKMDDMKRQNISCQEEIARLNAKLEESLAGLKAATRLGDQLESKTALINDLKEQVRTLQTSVAAAEERYYKATSNQQDKVDKNLVKNLLINYVMTAANNVTNKTQVLRILSTVLDFNQSECERLGLARSTNSGESLAAEFVRFLQNESTPRTALPDMMGLTRSTTPSRKSSTASGPIQTPTFDQKHKRNPSTGSNNLLFTNLDNVETSSQRSRDSLDIRTTTSENRSTAGENRPATSENQPTPVENRTTLDTGVTQTRNNEGAILKHVLRDM